jgi:hypothetical protein
VSSAAPVKTRVKGYLRAQHQRFVLNRTIKSLRRSAQELPPSNRLLEQLIYGWNNDGWSASLEFMHEMMARASEARGSILDCGSGLSTVLLGLVAERTGSTVWSLEHQAFWAERIAASLARHDFRRVNVCHAPLRSFGTFDWYDVDAAALPRDIALVVCDGPPEHTRGGRYGFLPVMRDHLAPGCVILLDDATRPVEQRVLDQWARELGTTYRVAAGAKPFAHLVVPTPRVSAV